MSFDKAKWQYDTAKKSYCEKYDKNPNSLTDEDEGSCARGVQLFQPCGIALR